MAEYTKRVQILLTDEQHDFLTELAEGRRRSVGDLVRTAFEEVYRPTASLREIRVLEHLRGQVYIEETPANIYEALLRPRFL
ncbi:MAG: hypothetical protein RIF32_07040 [Leptospirales bacterium]|jgi:Arc/MetJ-type ribon-helix-helix transcriptional regulator